jgi:hypothetical protein
MFSHDASNMHKNRVTVLFILTDITAVILTVIVIPSIILIPIVIPTAIVTACSPYLCASPPPALPL